jgi:chromate transporter
MARSLAPDRPRAAIAILALALTSFAPGGASQISAIAAGGVLGLALCRQSAEGGAGGGEAAPGSRRIGVVFLAAFFALLALSFLPGRAGTLAFLASIYRSGALVFGGGHVVLPLLQGALVAPGFVSQSAFLAGYGAAQAVPGPLFTFAAFLGAVANVPPGGALGAALALIAIFAPGILVLVGALPFWHALRARPGARAAMAGVNAAVVGLLASALYDPVWTSAVHRPSDFAVAAAGFAALVVWRAPPLAVVALGAVAGVILGVASIG